jgi:thioredoxin 2
MQGNKEAIVAALVRCEHCGRTNRVPAAATGIPRCGNCHQPLPWIADAGDGTFAEIAEAATIPVVVDLWAPGARPAAWSAPRWNGSPATWQAGSSW